MPGIERDLWEGALNGPTGRVGEFAVQLTRSSSGLMGCRLLSRMTGGVACIDSRHRPAGAMTVHDLTAITSSLFDALCREATILGGVQLTL